MIPLSSAYYRYFKSRYANERRHPGNWIAAPGRNDNVYKNDYVMSVKTGIQATGLRLKAAMTTSTKMTMSCL